MNLLGTLWLIRVDIRTIPYLCLDCLFIYALFLFEGLCVLKNENKMTERKK